jgi:hypothetical protein
MMLAVTGVFRNGVAEPTQTVPGREGLPVVITFLDESVSARRPVGEDLDPSPAEVESAWDALARLVEECKMDTGIGDQDLSSADPQVAWNAFERLVERCRVDTGIGDLAHEHDHYLHGTPKKGYRAPKKD